MATKGEERRQRIVNAANALFYHKGFAATSFADIAEDAGMPKGNFYFYFRTKEALLEAVVEDRLTRMSEMLTDWRDTIPEPKQRLHRIVEIPATDKENITKYGCPMGTLSAELGKAGTNEANFTVAMYDLLLAEMQTCFTQMGETKAKAQHLSHHLLVRIQGAANMAQAYGDERWITEETQAVHTWIDTL